MNTEQLKSLVVRILRDETQFKIQASLTDLNNALQQFVSAPQDSNSQVNVANKLTALESQIAKVVASYQPTEQKRLQEIGALEFFDNTVVGVIRKSMSENQMTPAVVQQQLEKFIQRRNTYLTNLEAISANLTALKVEEDKLSAGTAEIGFLIPRSLFNNELDGLIKELGVVRLIIRAFSELVDEESEPIEVHQISTTDPLFFFGLSTLTIGAIGKAVTWALSTWKQVEEIRKLRSEAAKNKLFTEEEIEAFFSNKVRKTIDQAIETKTNELVLLTKAEESRRQEERVALSWALNSIFARVERGMTVEIRFLPPPKVEGEQDAKAVATEAAFGEMPEISSQLLFPTPEAEPILALPPPKP